jgi:hypothetical protein
MPERLMEDPLGPLYFVWASLTGWGLVAVSQGTFVERKGEKKRGGSRKLGLVFAVLSILWTVVLSSMSHGAQGVEALAALVLWGVASGLCGGVWVCAWLSEYGAWQDHIYGQNAPGENVQRSET